MFLLHPMARALLCCTFCLLLSCLATAQVVPSVVYVDDSTRAFSEEDRSALEQELAAFHAETGVLLTVKAVAYLESSETMRRATQVARRATAPTGPVAAIMAERGKKGFGISHSPELWQLYPLADMVEVLRLAMHEASKPNPEIGNRLAVTSRLWMAQVRQLEAARRQGLPVLKEKEMPIFLAGIGVLGLLGLGGLYFGSREHVRTGLRNQRFPLPEAAVGQRLGAPFGGGRVVLWDQESQVS